MNILTGYLLVTGGLTAGLRVVRGVARGAGRALAGDARGALAEAAGGLIAPAAQVCREARLLTADALEAAEALAYGAEQEAPAAFTTQNAWAGGRHGVPRRPWHARWPGRGGRGHRRGRHRPLFLSLQGTTRATSLVDALLTPLPDNPTK